MKRYWLFSLLFILLAAGQNPLRCQDTLSFFASPAQLSKFRLTPALQQACDKISGVLMSIPGTFVEKRVGTFYDDYVRGDLDGCMNIISGSWSDLEGTPSPGDSLFTFLSNQGWIQQLKYSADGPDGTFFALSKEDVWCFVEGRWDGGDISDSTYVASDVYQFIVICTRRNPDN